jgi:RND family efflux transporter MFP subunit
MKRSRISVASAWAILRQVLLGAVFLAVVVLLMVWLAGGFKEKMAQGRAVPAPPAVYTGPRATVASVTLPRTEEAVGTVRPVMETVLTPRIAARITELNVTAGQKVTGDEVLVRLDDRDLKARVDQATAALASASATLDHARLERDRLATAYARGAATKTELDRAEMTLKNADADVIRAGEVINEAKAALEYTLIRAPTAGIVVDKRVNVGDTVMPGQVLATLYDPSHMQLVASVREMLTQRLSVSQPIGVRMDALGRTCQGTVREIVPEAESGSRTFQVKVTGPCPPGIYSGMFGRIIIPLDSQQVLVVPNAAVVRVGQLEMADVIGSQGDLQRRALQLGRRVADAFEVLSGLRAGEQVALHTPATRPAEGAHE